MSLTRESYLTNSAVFDQNRGVFGSQAVLKTPDSPGIVSKHSHTPNTNNSPFNTKQSLSNENYKTFGDKQMDNKVGKIPESPKAPPKKQTLTSKPDVIPKKDGVRYSCKT